MAAAPTEAYIPSAVGTVGAILRRDFGERRFLGVPFVLDLAFGVVNLVVFLFISRVLRHPAPAELGHAATYFDFVAVGIAFMLVVQAAGTQISTRIREEQRSGALEMLTGQPIAAGALAVGVSAYPIIFAVLRSAAYLGIAGLLLGLDMEHANWLGVTVVLALGAAAMMGLGIIMAAVTVTFDHGDTAGRLLIVAVGFMSGTYFPVSGLPAALRGLSTPLPTRIALDGLRAALSGHGWTGSALLLVLSAGLLLPLAVGLFTLAVRFATRQGTLTRG